MYCLTFGLDPGSAALGYLFGSRFPVRIAERRGWKALGIGVCSAVLLEWLFRLPWTVFMALDAEQATAYFHGPSGLMLPLVKRPPVIWKAEVVVIVVAIAMVLVRNYRRLPEPDQRRRIRWLTFGLIAALVPGALLYSPCQTGYAIRMNTPWFFYADALATATIGIVLPVTLGYAVLRYRILDIHLAIRTSIQYLLAKRVLQAVISLPLIVQAARAIANPHITILELLFGSYLYSAVILVAALGLIYGGPLLMAVDRRFFREAYNQEQILRKLIDEIKERDSISEISRAVSGKVEAALHPYRVLIFCRRESHNDFTLGHSSGSVDPELHTGADSRLLRMRRGLARFPLLHFRRFGHRQKRSTLPDWVSD